MRKILGLILLLAACAPSESQVRDEIKQASFCTVASDCVDVGTVCPFGCNIVVNQSQADHIRDLLSQVDANHCYYDCQASAGIACENKTCVVKRQ